ncbi:TolC family outer membrane protein [Caulobacter sp. S45]|uniref:TolC family outer membrane protein n=1 Tax=Caulobacter sp. S45 TaxID=1641861 RepID=UPI00157517E9|nr:TolC family outer membrane protein [Caulobacter sp. S45]
MRLPRASRRGAGSVAGLAAGLVLAGAPARAETLAEAIAYAYDTNPTLLSQRAQLQATDETYVQAEAGFRPTASLQVLGAYAKGPQLEGVGNQRFTTETNTGSAVLSLSQPLYTGGRTTAQVHGAEAQIRAGREQLRAVETTVLQQVVQAYCDVQRDRSALAIQREGYKTLFDETDEIKARHEAGAATITDVEQAQTQLESAHAAVQSAQAQLEVSAAEYVNAVGRSPGDLAIFPALPGFPIDLDNAFDIADQENPTLRQAQFTEAANRAEVEQAKAERRPNLTLNGQFGYSGPAVPAVGDQFDRTVAVTATLTQPIFSGGVIGSQVRQATASDTSARVQAEAVRRNVVQAVSQAWSQRRAAELNVATEAAAARAAQATFDGMRVEYRAGLRETLDLLIAQETLTSARISLAQAAHDQALEGAAVLAAVGRLEARALLQGAPLYKPQTSFRRVEGRGSVPWEFIPKALDRIGAPAPPQPSPLPEPPAPTGAVRIASPAAGTPQAPAVDERLLVATHPEPNG